MPFCGKKWLKDELSYHRRVTERVFRLKLKQTEERIMAALFDAWLSVKEDITDLRHRLDDALAALDDDGDIEALKAEVLGVTEDMKKFDADYDAEFPAAPAPEPVVEEPVAEEPIE